MELNRNHLFVVGVVVLLLGVQLRMVDSFLLTQPATQFLAERLKKPQVASTSAVPDFYQANTPVPRQLIKPPSWVGWALLSAGGVLVLQSLAMGKPD